MGDNLGGRTALKRERRAVLTTRRSEIVSSLAAAGIDPNSEEGLSAQVWGNSSARCAGSSIRHRSNGNTSNGWPNVSSAAQGGH